MKRSRSDSGGSYGRHASVRLSSAPGSLSAHPSEGDQHGSSLYQRPSSNGLVRHTSLFQQPIRAVRVPRDPRPLKDRSYQAGIRQELFHYLAQHNCKMETKHTLSQNAMTSPTQKDFTCMFQWLYHHIDPNHRFLRTIDQEVPSLLKQLRYPFEGSITKSQITAAGGQNWSTLLGLLHWMMQVVQMMDGYACHRYGKTSSEAGVGGMRNPITLDFLGKAYRGQLGLGPDADDNEKERALMPHIQAMVKVFDRSHSEYQSELNMLEAENTRLQKEIKEMEESMEDVEALDADFQTMSEDKIEFETYNAKITERCDKYEGRVAVLEDEYEKLTQELKEAEDECCSLQKKLEDQGINIQAMDHMASEREMLRKRVDSAAQQREVSEKKVKDKELKAGSQLDELNLLVDKYNTLARQVGPIPHTATNAKGEQYKLTITVNESTFVSSVVNGLCTVSTRTERLLANPDTGYQPAHVLSLDLRGRIATFAALRNTIRERRSAIKDATTEDRDLLTDIDEVIVAKQTEIEALKHRVRAAEKDYQMTQEVTGTQKLRSDAQIEKIEKELAEMRIHLIGSIQTMDLREMNTKIEYEKLVLGVNSLREELHTKLEQILQGAIKFKLHIRKVIENYEYFVTEDLERELAGNDAGPQDSDI